MTDEKLAIGLFLGGGEGPFFAFSERRLNLLKNILHKNSFNALNRNLKSLKLKIDEERASRSDLMLFDPTYTVDEFDRMNKQLKGVLIYSAPTVINDWANRQLFNQFIKQFLGEKLLTSSTRKKASFHLKWQSFCRVKRKENWKNKVALSSLNPAIAIPLRMDLLHLPSNTLVKGIDFDLSKKNCEERLYTAQIAAKELVDYTSLIVYATPKTKAGKKQLIDAQKLKGNVEFLLFNDFVKRYK